MTADSSQRVGGWARFDMFAEKEPTHPQPTCQSFNYNEKISDEDQVSQKKFVGG